MPLTDFQKGIARLIAANRTPESHLAGGAVINRGESGIRVSDDFDIFHDTFGGGRTAAEVVAAYAEVDERLLKNEGYSVAWQDRREGFFRAIVRRGADFVQLDWTTDSAYRFFPVQRDDDFGYCLHPADLATNKALALVGRSKVRDFLDILQLDQDYLSLGAIVWAACDKDPGYTPDLILNMTNRHSSYRQSDLADANLVRPVDLRELKRHWIEARERAEILFEQLPEDDLGCLYLDRENRPVTPDPGSPEFPGLIRHFGSLGGAWPTIS